MPHCGIIFLKTLNKDQKMTKANIKTESEFSEWVEQLTHLAQDVT